MSLDISLSDHEGNTIAEMNWLRNPYGLCDWAQDNVSFVEKTAPQSDLWHVVNDWSYGDSDQIDRSCFLQVVTRYAEVIGAMGHLGLPGYFWFDVGQYMQFVQPNMHIFTRSERPFMPSAETVRIEGNVFHNHKIGLPMHYFEAPCFYLRYAGMREPTLLEHYKNWMLRLVDFADKLQNPTTTFYCSN